VLHGSLSSVLSDEDGQILEAHSISAGLDYPGVGPEHAQLRDSGRARYEAVTDAHALLAFRELSRLEGIVPALEPAHAIAWALSNPGAEGYDLLILDAFSSDAPPAHLLTREALQLYFNRLTPGGVLAFNVSNKYVNLTSVLANAGADLGMATYQRVDLEGTPSSIAAGIFPSAWIVMARSPSDLAALVSRPGWVPAQTDASHPVWTDDFSNVLSVTVFR